LVCELATTLGNDLAHDAGEANEVHLAAMLAGLGRMVVPERILEAHRRGITLTDGEAEVWRRIPSTGHALLRHLPGFEDVARSVLLQACRFDGGGSGNVSEKGEALPLGARTLKFCHDLADLEATGHVRRNAVALLAKRNGAYDPRVVQAAEFLWALPLATTRELSARYCFAAAVADLRQGQTLRSDVLTADGMLLVAAGKQLTSTVLERILNFAESCGVREPIEVDALLPRAA
jgi:response regulator RpfG family c-di-GMP phosphodiesterase